LDRVPKDFHDLLGTQTVGVMELAVPASIIVLHRHDDCDKALGKEEQDKGSRKGSREAAASFVYMQRPTLGILHALLRSRGESVHR
jgi:hypothetical protein